MIDIIIEVELCDNIEGMATKGVLYTLLNNYKILKNEKNILLIDNEKCLEGDIINKISDIMIRILGYAINSFDFNERGNPVFMMCYDVRNKKYLIYNERNINIFKKELNELKGLYGGINNINIY